VGTRREPKRKADSRERFAAQKTVALQRVRREGGEAFESSGRHIKTVMKKLGIKQFSETQPEGTRERKRRSSRGRGNRKKEDQGKYQSRVRRNPCMAERIRSLALGK